jgi:GNAT superfamily N-acetyltransferase
MDNNIEFKYGVVRNPIASDEIVLFLTEHWGSKDIVSSGKITDASLLPRITVHDENNKLMGLATYSVDPKSNSCELVSIDSTIQGKGVGSQLLAKVEDEARQRGCQKIWLITTNDNLEAANFYSRKGYRLVRVHLNALDESRKLKASIPKIGNHGIPLQDEWEFEKILH